MLDFIFLAAFVALPLVAWLVSRNILATVIAFTLAIGISGNLLQTLVAMGQSWSLKGIQLLTVASFVTAAITVVFVCRGRGNSLSRQFTAVVLPTLLVAAAIVAFRLIAPGAPGPLTAVGYLVNHPLAEDNAKWLNLSGQLASGVSLEFNGYAGGPLVILMAIAAALVSVLSLIFLGGINEVAVAANSLIVTQMWLVMCAPLALAGFAQHRFSRLGGSNTRAFLPVPLVWAGALVLVLGSAIVTSYGHLSQQFLLSAVALWVSTFLVTQSRLARLGSSLVIVTAASVWWPINALALLVLVGMIVTSTRGRWWPGLVLAVIVALVSLDAILSSLLYSLGIPVTPQDLLSRLVGASSAQGSQLGNAASPGIDGEVIASAHLLRAPGATEALAPIIGVLLIASVLAALWWLEATRRVDRRRYLPMVLLGGYLTAVACVDSVVTATSPNYGLTKAGFTFGVAVLAATLPIALMALDANRSGMSTLRWAGVGLVLVALILDSLLPRALSAMSPKLWVAVESQGPQYWSPAEVKLQGQQNLQGAPIACLFVDPDGSAPSALPLGQESYSCTRLLLGVTGLESDGQVLSEWLRSDWLQQRSTWPEYRQQVAELPAELLARPIILMKQDGGLAGLTTLKQLVTQFP